jgi:surfeit locus 1 family protein
MTARRVPVFSTIIVLTAVATMVALGVWQLGRRAEKEALIASYERSLQSSDMRPFPADYGGAFSEDDLFRPTAFDCTAVLSREAIAGRSSAGQLGFAHVARCQTGRGPADVVLGWSRDPAFPQYRSGVVVGLIVPGGKDGARVQMREPIAGLQPLAKPDPGDLPNNHLAYAGQWFFFALTALVIYAFAVRARSKKNT